MIEVGVPATLPSLFAFEPATSSREMQAGFRAAPGSAVVVMEPTMPLAPEGADVSANADSYADEYAVSVGSVLSVNLARVRPNPDAPSRRTGIDKAPADDEVMVRAPGPMRGGLGSGLVGDSIGNQKLHGGDDQAVYAYAREDLDRWEADLARPLTNGMFGENLTTSAIDVTEALIGEQWRIGSDGPLLEVSAPRTPCRTFSAFLQLDNWIKTFTRAAKPGAYLRVLSPGPVRPGDAISIEYRPDHDVTINLVFRARMSEPDLLPHLLKADALSSELKAYARRRIGANQA
jgi:MOSC domain-containing protein YiiM